MRKQTQILCAQEPKHAPEFIPRVLDKCNIWKENNGVISDLGRSFSSFPEIIAGLLRAGAQPEKISYEVICKSYADYFGSFLDKRIGFDELVNEYKLK